SKVDCAKDLKTAKVYMTVSGETKEEREAVLSAVQASAGFIRKELAADFKALRTVPSLTFILDESGVYGARIDELLAGLGRG
ncbi:MAG: 30S ribosome-binding factor RbfA, partial [Firmicutes bacterium]|nr:30S ribosome-binding factor RbfA [Bacillota bacterium]